MNDRYLYRAKRTDNGEWVEGYYAFIDNHHYIYTGDLCNGGLYVVAERFEIDIDTLCACTGLKDKNGKLIWENDILKYKWDGKEIIDVIKYEAPIFTYSKSMRWSLHKDEVIGNIFDDPELLEVG